MRKKGKKWFGLLIARIILCTCGTGCPSSQQKSTQLVNSSGKKVQLRGISAKWKSDLLLKKLEGKCSAFAILAPLYRDASNRRRCLIITV